MQTHVHHITYRPETHTAHLFFWGCNMRCRGCIRKLHGQDSHLVDPGGPRGSVEPPLLTQDEVLAALAPHRVRRIFFLGDDPTTDPAVEALASALKERFRAENVLLTNGLLLPPHHLFGDVQLSIKAVTPGLHRDFTGVDGALVLEHFRHLHRAGVNLRTESIIIPEYIDAPEIRRIAEFVASVDPEIPYRLDAYIPVPGAPWRRPTLEEMECAVSAAREHLQQVSVLHGRTGNGYEVVCLV